MTTPTNNGGRLLVVGDLERLGPAVSRALAPWRIEGVRTLLEGIAELPRAETCGVLVGHDPTCRQLGAAMAALRQAAGSARVIFCCEPADEGLGRQMVARGADDYVILPLERDDLRQAFGTIEPADVAHEARDVPTGSVEGDPRDAAAPPAEAPPPDPLEELAALMPDLLDGAAATLDRVAALIAQAVSAESVLVRMDDAIGRHGPDRDVGDALLVHTISRNGEKIGAIRVGRSTSGGYSIEDVQRVRGHAVVLGRLAEAAARAERWRQLALADELTGLPNRRHLMSFLDETLKQAEAAKSTVTALVFDIDDFKRYNDRYGHDAGDEILCEVGRLFVQCSRRTDMVARHGGDEFVVVFWDPEGPRTLGSRHPEGVLMIVQRFRAALKKHRFSRLGQDSQGVLTISGGLAHFPWQARTAAELLEAADRALLRAKEAGKNRFYILGDETAADAGSV
jgi:two-component system cell cycle response regulator